MQFLSHVIHWPNINNKTILICSSQAKDLAAFEAKTLGFESNALMEELWVGVCVSFTCCS